MRTPRAIRVKLIEDYVGNGMMISDIAKKHSVSNFIVRHAITCYLQKPPLPMRLQSKINFPPGESPLLKFPNRYKIYNNRNLIHPTE